MPKTTTRTEPRIDADALAALIADLQERLDALAETLASRIGFGYPMWDPTAREWIFLDRSRLVELPESQVEEEREEHRRWLAKEMMKGV